MSDFTEILQASNSWPVQCAKKISSRLKNSDKDIVIFETGYGPSGLPHIGTFGEVARTKFVQNTFEKLTGKKTILYVVSDDYDGMRKIPSNLPNQEMLANYIDMPLTSIPDPFGEKASYGEYMNSKLRSFLDSFGFEYEFKSATELYKSGAFDEYLMKALSKYEEIMAVMLPTLGEDRRKTYSPFLPICQDTGKVLYVAIDSIDKIAGTVSFIHPVTKKQTINKVTAGQCKLQWKPDFGVRWAALGIDFEMYGKDHLANGPIYSKICKIVGGNPPEQFVYELFLDKDGRKISKSKGNEEVTVDGWLKYAPTESLALFMFQNPQRAKKLFFETLPKSVDEYVTYVSNFHEEDDNKKVNNPVWFIHNGEVPVIETFGVSYSLLLNLAAVCNPTNKEILWGYIRSYSPGATPSEAPFLDHLVQYAINYYNDFLKDQKNYKTPNDQEMKMLKSLKDMLISVSDANLDAQELQNIFYQVGKENNFENIKDYFQSLYEILLGQSQGPRLGSFTKLYGVDAMVELIETTLNKKR